MAAAALLSLGNTSMDSEDDAKLRAGREIYNEGVGGDPIMVRLGEGRWQPAGGTLTCRACHGEAGEGSSEGGIIAPALGVRGDRPAVAGWLAEAVVRHRGGKGRKLGEAMPLYRVTERDLAALSAYVGRLPNVPVPGLTPKTVTVGVNVSDASLTLNGKRRLAKTVGMLAKSVQDGGGIYGRAIEFAVTDGAQAERGDTLIQIAWTAKPGAPPLTFAIQSDGEVDASCGTLDPTREQMALAIADADRNATSDAVILSRFAGWTERAMAAAQLYLSPELAAELRPRAPKAKIHVVAPGDISMRVAMANDLLEAGTEDPRDAMVIAVYREALDVVLEVLRTNGRRVYPYATCNAVKRVASSRQKVSIIEDGGVNTISAFLNNGS